jgi:hypothetical protein
MLHVARARPLALALMNWWMARLVARLPQVPAVAARVAGQAPQEPYVPGSGARSLCSFGWCWLASSVLLVACSLAPWPAPRPLCSLLLFDYVDFFSFLAVGACFGGSGERSRR